MTPNGQSYEILHAYNYYKEKDSDAVLCGSCQFYWRYSFQFNIVASRLITTSNCQDVNYCKYGEALLALLKCL